MVQPVTGDRLVTLDAIRGVAVIGILAMNIIGFSMLSSSAVSPNLMGGTSCYDRAAFVLASIFFDGKMRGLFSLLFGASMALIVDRAAAKGEDPARIHYARMAVLFLFGLAHYLFLWDGDILMEYALVGSVAFLFLYNSPRALVRMALLLFAANLAILASTAGSVKLIETQAASAAPGSVAQQDYAAMVAAYSDPGEPVNLRELAATRGDYADVVAYRASADQIVALPAILLLWGAETLAYMLLGAALLRSGFFSSGWSRTRLWRLALITGLPAILALSVIMKGVWSTNFPPIASFVAYFGWTPPFDILLTLAYAALLVLAIPRFPASALVARLTAAGRMAFSNYLGTSLVMTTIFYGYGFNLFGTVPRAQVYLFVLGGGIAMLLWSKPWLERFHYGPLEWLWRSMARREWQRMRRSGTEKAP